MNKDRAKQLAGVFRAGSTYFSMCDIREAADLLEEAANEPETFSASTLANVIYQEAKSQVNQITALHKACARHGRRNKFLRSKVDYLSRCIEAFESREREEIVAFLREREKDLIVGKVLDWNKYALSQEARFCSDTATLIERGEHIK